MGKNINISNIDWRNTIMKIKCLICEDVIESKSVHDLESCKM